MYTDFCRVTGTPEELIIDFGLTPQPFGVPTVPIHVNCSGAAGGYAWQLTQFLTICPVSILTRSGGWGVFGRVGYAMPSSQRLFFLP